MFTTEEAGAMLIAGKLIDKLTDKSIQKAYSAAIDKIKSVLPEREKDSLEEMDHQIQVFYSRQSPEHDYPNNFIAIAQKALAESKCLKTDYHANYSQEITKGRVIDPLGLVFYGNSWHLIAFCKMRQEMRDFRLDRIMDMQIIDECASPKNPKELKRYFEELWQTADLFEVKVWFHKSVLNSLNQSKYYFGFIDQAEKDDGVLMSFAVTDYKYIGSWLLSFAGFCKVESPEELKNEMLGAVKELARVYLR
jgi:predicted DNA-binding transcriptional regulator YafY